MTDDLTYTLHTQEALQDVGYFIPTLNPVFTMFTMFTVRAYHRRVLIVGRRLLFFLKKQQGFSANKKCDGHQRTRRHATAGQE
jgi:hypothetical protein